MEDYDLEDSSENKRKYILVGLGFILIMAAIVLSAYINDYRARILINKNQKDYDVLLNSFFKETNKIVSSLEFNVNLTKELSGELKNRLDYFNESLRKINSTINNDLNNLQIRTENQLHNLMVEINKSKDKINNISEFINFTLE